MSNLVRTLKTGLITMIGLRIDSVEVQITTLHQGPYCLIKHHNDPVLITSVDAMMVFQDGAEC